MNVKQTETKHIVITVPGAGERSHRDVYVVPGTTAGDVLREIGLEGYWLKQPGADAFFGMDESIWDSIKDGDKLEASSPAVVGYGRNGATLVAPLILPRARAPMRVAPGPAPVIVRPSKRSYFDYRGWKWLQKRHAVGWYRTKTGSWKGELRLDLMGKPRFFVLDPPPSVLAGIHAACFVWKGPQRGYGIHFATQPADIDSALMVVEATLAGRT